MAENDRPAPIATNMQEEPGAMENVTLSDYDDVEFGGCDAGRAVPGAARPKTKSSSLSSSSGRSAPPITGFSVDHDYVLGEQRLDARSWLIVACVLLGWALTSWMSPSFALSYPIFFLPFAYLVYRSRTAQLLLVNHTIGNFGVAFALAPIVLIVLTLFLWVAFPVFDRAGSIYFSLFMIIFVQVLVEELLKYRLIRNKVDIDESASIEIRQMQYLDLSRSLFTAMSLSLGYGTYQGLFVSLLLAYSAHDVWAPLLISAVVAVLYIPSHCMTGYLIGLQLARKTVLHDPLPAAVVVLWPVLFRSLFLFQFLFWAGTNSHPVLAWAITSVTLTSALVLYIRHVKKKLPRDYLDNAGYNVVLGYIPVVDDPI